MPCAWPAPSGHLSLSPLRSSLPLLSVQHSASSLLLPRSDLWRRVGPRVPNEVRGQKKCVKAGEKGAPGLQQQLVVVERMSEWEM